MAWERRGNQVYFYHSRRLPGGRVVKSYCGCGEMAHYLSEFLASSAEVEAALRAERRMRRRTPPPEQVRYRQIEQEVKAFSASVDAVLREIAGRFGCYQHKRGPWRRRGQIGRPRTKELQSMDTLSSDSRNAIAALAEKPKPTVPGATVMGVAHIANLGRTGIIEAIPSDLQTRAAIYLDARRKFAEVAGPNPTPLESLLAERVVTNWLMVNYAEATLAVQSNTKHVEHWEKRVDAATRRYLASIKTLAQVRRLQLPTVNIAMPGATQVNVGEKQVNLTAEKKDCFPQ